ncbi:hypothetical protein F8M41_007526 [Gigaspora margarita]|uniref:Restriction endonuclease type IV Mrr domain-containing protein n=1 Tax=Gigaspora margarita TaxID=4874 RepID=A0A8H4ER74_GIGMA|nr:hypothetical protein F8M41_007526 [Gigaspora margarita]
MNKKNRSSVNKFKVKKTKKENTVQKSCKKYKQGIKDLILSTEGFKYCRSYENEYEIFYSDRDKYLITEYEDFKIFICCKFRKKKNIGFNDIERTSGFIKSYHPDDTGIIVTNKNFSDNSYGQASKMKKKVQEGSYEPKELVVEVEVIDEEN